MWTDLMVAGNSGYEDDRHNNPNYPQSAEQWAHSSDNYMMMQHFAYNILHDDNGSLSDSDMEWMEDLLCEYGCPGPCRKTEDFIPASAEDDFPCNNEPGGHWDCGILFWDGPATTAGCVIPGGGPLDPGMLFNPNSYLLAYNLYHLAGGTTNDNYLNPFDYEITPDNNADISSGYQGAEEFLRVEGNLRPCDRTIQQYQFVGTDLLCFDEVTSSENIEVLSFWSGLMKIRILSRAEDSWVELYESDPNCEFDECHLPRRVRIKFDIKSKCEVGCASNIYSDLHIYSNTTWGIDDAKSFLSSNVFVHTGATLTIENTTAFFDSFSGLHVERGAKLHVDGGTLTNCPNGGKWPGVSVAGNSAVDQAGSGGMPAPYQSGTVLLTSAKIIGAHTGVSTKGWAGNSVNPAYNGGLVHAENTTFEGNGVGAYIKKYDKTNKSRFIGCTFSNPSLPPTPDNPNGISFANGVVIEDTDGIEFSGSTFTGMYKDGAGIKIYDAGCTVNGGCQFSDSSFGLAAYSTTGVSSPEKIKVVGAVGVYNSFSNIRVGIRSDAKDLMKSLEVYGNIFNNAKQEGVRLSGTTSSLIRDNSFNACDIGISTYSLGGNFNEFKCNQFTTSGLAGVFLEGNHSFTTITRNNFIASPTFDYVLSENGNTGEQGRLFPQQGGKGNPADNCFSFTVPHNLITSGNTESFNYYVPNTANLCKIPTFNQGMSNYAILLTNFNQNPAPCTFPNLQDDCPNPSFNEYVVASQDYHNTEVLLAQIPGDEDLLTSLYHKGNMKDCIKSGIIRQALLTGNTQPASQIFNYEGTTTAKRQQYGMQLQLNDYVGAAATLQAIPLASAEDVVFAQVQSINLDRLATGPSFELSAQREAFLTGIAEGNTSSREYAMALLSMLKGKEFYLEHTPVAGMAGRENVAPPITKAAGHYLLKPNPTTGRLTVTLPTEAESAVSISVISLSGAVEKSFKFTEGAASYEINLQGLPNGIYFVRTVEGSKMIGTEKVLLSR
ncbi:MAG: T9SS type A sorting domain-containing protein [Saprospiraceae bacterium]|nr:T9SS type A sorting domain-containing protein [Saprospiraceae bacterium]